MPRLTKVTGSQQEVLTRVLGVNFISARLSQDMLAATDYEPRLRAILNDLIRERFLPTGNKTTLDFIRAWMDLPTNNYVQGDMTGALYKVLSSNFILSSPAFIKAGTNRTEENRVSYANLRTLQLSYYDDHGCLCGLAIIYSPLDPSLWHATVIRNTTAASTAKEVLFLSSQEFVDPTKGIAVDGRSAHNDFLAQLRSQQVRELFEHRIVHERQNNDGVETDKFTLSTNVLEPVIQQNGTVNVNKLEVLQTYFIAKAAGPLRNQTLAARAALFTRLSNLKYSRKTFIQRNNNNLLVGTFALLILMIILLLPSLAPLSFTLAAGLTTYLTFGGITITTMIAMISFVKIIANELPRIAFETISRLTARAADVYLHLFTTAEVEPQVIIDHIQTVVPAPLIIPSTEALLESEVVSESSDSSDSPDTPSSSDDGIDPLTGFDQADQDKEFILDLDSKAANTRRLINSIPSSLPSTANSSPKQRTSTDNGSSNESPTTILTEDDTPLII